MVGDMLVEDRRPSRARSRRLTQVRLVGSRCGTDRPGETRQGSHLLAAGELCPGGLGDRAQGRRPSAPTSGRRRTSCPARPGPPTRSADRADAVPAPPALTPANAGSGAITPPTPPAPRRSPGAHAHRAGATPVAPAPAPTPTPSLHEPPQPTAPLPHGRGSDAVSQPAVLRDRRRLADARPRGPAAVLLHADVAPPDG